MAEYKKDFAQLKKSVKKCLCPLEKPLNSKHARIVVMKTHQLQSSEPIWILVKTQNITANRFATWKFCNLMHKILHEGHPQSLRESIKYQENFLQFAQYWSRQEDHMGQCIAWCCKVLNTKLTFHQTYSYFKGNFQLEYDEPLWDMNICFQLCLDIFDYLENLLHLQRVIFTNIEKHQISTTSKKGICRLASLVTIIAECNLLYQHSITVLRLLHSQLPSDDVSGLRDRFNVIFEELTVFYAHVRSMRLSLDYLDIPEMPNLKPNLYTLVENLQEPSAPLIADLY